MADDKITPVRRLFGATVSFLALAAIIALFFAYRERAALPIHPPKFSTSIEHLPYYAFCSFYRMLAAYVLALFFRSDTGCWRRVAESGSGC